MLPILFLTIFISIDSSDLRFIAPFDRPFNAIIWSIENFRRIVFACGFCKRIFTVPLNLKNNGLARGSKSFVYTNTVGRYHRWLIFCHHRFYTVPKQFNNVICLQWTLKLFTKASFYYNLVRRPNYIFFYITEVVIFRLQLRRACVTARWGCCVGVFAPIFLWIPVF